MTVPSPLVLIVSLALLLTGCGDCRSQHPAPPAGAAAAASDEPTVWVTITRKVEKGKNYMHGRMRASDLREMTRSAQLPAVVCLHDCFWYNDYGVVLLESEEDTGVVYLRIDNLISIDEQKPRDIAKLRLEEAEAVKKKEAAERAEEEKKKVVP